MGGLYRGRGLALLPQLCRGLAAPRQGLSMAASSSQLAPQPLASTDDELYAATLMAELEMPWNEVPVQRAPHSIGGRLAHVAAKPPDKLHQRNSQSTVQPPSLRPRQMNANLSAASREFLGEARSVAPSARQPRATLGPSAESRDGGMRSVAPPARQLNAASFEFLGASPARQPSAKPSVTSREFLGAARENTSALLPVRFGELNARQQRALLHDIYGHFRAKLLDDAPLLAMAGLPAGERAGAAKEGAEKNVAGGGLPVHLMTYTAVAQLPLSRLAAELRARGAKNIANFSATKGKGEDVRVRMASSLVQRLVIEVRFISS
ncbi:hypothetical protein T492DRAFT_844646 [Pavlovales sp. CCMP2436]|nr:hypothetical protein T492DRAFT_844646 [Pavlovales sp. CCMP2436]